jgi:D-lactate dehydrogenase
LCATGCPVSINTGELTKQLRAENVKSERVANWVAENFRLVEKSLGWGVRIGHVFEPRTPRTTAGQGYKGPKKKSLLASTAKVAEKVTGMTLPKWNCSVPFPTKNISELTSQPGDRALRGEKEFVYFPSCISRQLGMPPSTAATSSPPLRAEKSLAETLIIVANRANLGLAIPTDIEGVCCGMPFSSKGYTKTYKATLHKTISKFWEWSQGGKYPIVIDTTSCAYTLHTCKEALSEDDLDKYQGMIILDSLEFIHDTLLPNLEVHPVDEDVALHPNCSARKLGLDGKMLSIAQKCARSATVPLNLGCCGFAGDRGLLYPELTASATEKESAEVLEGDYTGYYSSNITCEMGMSEATGKDYVGIVYLVEKATR